MKIWQQKPKRGKALWTKISGLKPNGWTGERPKARSRLKPRSRSYAARMKVYRARVRIFLSLHPFCAVFPKTASNQVHHRFGRVGRLLLWEPGWIGVSAAGHDWIQRNPAAARKRGLLAPMGAWNDYDAAVCLNTSKQRKETGD